MEKRKIFINHKVKSHRFFSHILDTCSLCNEFIIKPACGHVLHANELQEFILNFNETFFCPTCRQVLAYTYIVLFIRIINFVALFCNVKSVHCFRFRAHDPETNELFKNHIFWLNLMTYVFP